MNEIIKQRIDAIRRSEVLEGYHKTKLGILPKEWLESTIDDCLTRVERPVEVDPNELYTQIGIRSHGKGLFYKEPVTGESLGNKSVFWIEPDCFILNIVFAWEQAVSKTSKKEIGMIGSHRFPMYRPIKNKIDVDYLIMYLLTKRGTDILEAASPGGAGRNRTLGQDRFMKSKLILPDIAEQQKIAAILTTQDKVIELKEKLLAEKRRQKKYLCQQLLTGKKRLLEFNDKWKKCRISDVSLYKTSSQTAGALENCTGQNTYPVYDANSICAYVDFYEHSKEYISIVKDGAGAGRVRQCQAYSSTIGTIGCIFPNEAVHIAFLYYIMCNIDFSKYSNGSTIPHVYFKDYGTEKICIPTLEEQSAIAAVLSAADHEIELLQKDIEAEKKKKKSLMQLLLTGIVRVKV